MLSLLLDGADGLIVLAVIVWAAIIAVLVVLYDKMRR
jgi:hypothetical protein